MASAKRSCKDCKNPFYYKNDEKLTKTTRFNLSRNWSKASHPATNGLLDEIKDFH